MKYELFKSEYKRSNQKIISSALAAMHSCENDYNLDEHHTPFTVDTKGKTVIISVDDSYELFNTIVNAFTEHMNKKIADIEAYKNRQAGIKMKKAINRMDARLSRVHQILKIAEDKVLFHKKDTTITISIKGDHSYNIEQMRKLCTLFNKYNPVFTCRSNYFIITVTIV